MKDSWEAVPVKKYQVVDLADAPLFDGGFADKARAKLEPLAELDGLTLGVVTVSRGVDIATGKPIICGVATAYRVL